MLEATPEADAHAAISIRSDVSLSRSGRAQRLLQADGSAVAATPNPALVRLLVRARHWWVILTQGEIDISKLAANEGLQSGYITGVLPLAFLASDVVDTILAGRARAGVYVAALTATGAIAPQSAAFANLAARRTRDLPILSSPITFLVPPFLFFLAIIGGVPVLVNIII